MMNLLLIAILLILVVMSTVFTLLAVKIKRKYERTESFFVEAYLKAAELFIPAKAGEPAPLAAMAISYIHYAGQAFATEIKTSLMGKMSGSARLEQAVEGEVQVAAMAAGNPLLNALLQVSPALSKRLSKNPALASFVMQAAGKLFSKPGPGAGNGHSEQANFNL
jgi:hypothetical protein